MEGGREGQFAIQSRICSISGHAREGESVARSGGGVGGLDECANRSGETKKVAIAERLLL